MGGSKGPELKTDPRFDSIAARFRNVADYFKVRAVNEREYLLKHDLECDEWFLGQQW